MDRLQFMHRNGQEDGLLLPWATCLAFRDRSKSFLAPGSTRLRTGVRPNRCLRSKKRTIPGSTSAPAGDEVSSARTHWVLVVSSFLLRAGFLYGETCVSRLLRSFRGPEANYSGLAGKYPGSGSWNHCRLELWRIPLGKRGYGLFVA